MSYTDTHLQNQSASYRGGFHLKLWPGTVHFLLSTQRRRRKGTNTPVLTETLPVLTSSSQSQQNPDHILPKATQDLGWMTRDLARRMVATHLNNKTE